MRKRKLGDRYDGYRVKNCDPTNVIIPFLLKERDDSQVFLTQKLI